MIQPYLVNLVLVFTALVFPAYCPSWTENLGTAINPGIESDNSPLFFPAPGSPIPLGGPPGNILMGDVNGDGKQDLVASVGRDHSIVILLGNGRGTFVPAVSSPLRFDVAFGEMGLADFNGDKNLDLALASHDSYNVTVLLGNGKGGFTPAPGSPFPAGQGKKPHTHGLVVGDVNRDGKTDIITANNEDGNIAVLLGDGKGGFLRASGSPFRVGPGPYPIGLGDINGDDRLDVVAPNTVSNGTVTVLLGDGKGAFTAAPASPASVVARPYYVAIGDLDGNGKPDIAVAHDDTSQVSVLLGDGKGRFRPAPGSLLDVGHRGFAIVLTDMNGDGKRDLVEATNSDVTVLLGDGRGRFQPAPGSPYPAGPGAWRLTVGDIDGDGQPDIAASNLEGNSITLLIRAHARSR
ncbi:MAG TPA: VCBS repeat-containing protein [Acidobacteriota bacterium]|jgi:ATP:corrinoid adenosyltransferase